MIPSYREPRGCDVDGSTPGTRLSVSGYGRLFRGLLRRSLLVFYYSSIPTRSPSGMMCRTWGWLHGAAKDIKVVEKPGFRWHFELSEEVKLRNSRFIGMIWCRWIRFGYKLYEIKIGKRYYVLYEHELVKTDLRTYSKVAIQEIKFKSLREGHYCLPTKRPLNPMYSNMSQPRVVKLS